MEIGSIFAEIATFSNLIPLIVLFLVKRNREKELRVFYLYLWYSAIFSIYFRINSALSINSLPHVQLSTLLGFTLIGFIYYSYMKRLFFRKLIMAFIIIFALFAIINAFWIEGLYSTATYSTTLNAVLGIILCMIYFYDLTQRKVYTYILKEPMFWITVAFLFYFAGNLFLYLSSSFFMIDTNSSFFVEFWIMFSLMIVLRNLLFVVALWKGHKMST